MDISSFAEIDDDGLTGFRQLVERHRLSFAELGPGALFGLRLLIHEVGELYPIEWKLALFPVFAPRLDHEREHVAVLIRTGSVRLALIPDDAANSVRHHGFDATVIQVRGAKVAGGGTIGEREVGRHFLA